MNPTIVYIDMDDVMCDYSTSLRHAQQKYPCVPFPQSLPGFYVNLHPIAGAIKAVNQLRETFNVYVLTAPSTKNPLSYTEKRLWIENHFGYPFTERLIISPNKGLLKGDFLVDDNASGKGQENFEGELIQFGSQSFPDWPTVLQRLVGDNEEG